jgi:hypothetical protein
MGKTNFRMERLLHFEMAGEQKTGSLIIEGVDKVDSGTCICYFTLPFIVSDKRHKCAGVDELRALEMCLRTVRDLIFGSEEDGFAVVWWLEKGDHGGFD